MHELQSHCTATGLQRHDTLGKKHIYLILEAAVHQIQWVKFSSPPEKKGQRSSISIAACYSNEKLWPEVYQGLPQPKKRT